jgi:hypothetical protein
MPFRDELHASRERVHILEQELEVLRSESARGKQLEARLEELSRELGRANAELVRLRGPAPGERRSRLAAGVVVASLLTGVAAAGALFVLRPRSAAVANGVDGAQARSPARVAAPATLAWEGRVKSVVGTTTLATGAPCRVAATTRGVEVRSLELRCGEVVLYDAHKPTGGVDSPVAEIYESPDGDGYRYQLRYADLGPRSGPRAQIDLDSARGSAAAWREVPSAMRVEIDLERESARREEALLITGGAWVGGEATVTKIDGRAPLSVGAACRVGVRVTRQGGTKNCVAAVRCGQELLYGGLDLGFSRCHVDGQGQPRTFRDEEVADDPALDVDLDHRSASLRTRGYTLKLALEE